MKKIIANNRAEGHIDTGVKIIIAVVIGALILGGLYMLFVGNNGIFDKLSDKIYDISNTGGERSMKLEDGKLLYTYDEETWVEATITGLEETGTVTKYLTFGEGESLVHLVSYKNTTGARACYSLDGKEWIPFNSDKSSIRISTNSNNQAVYLSCGDGRSYYSTNGLDWIMTSTKSY